MAKVDNQRNIATPEQRVLAHKLTEARAAEKGWKDIADRRKSALRDSAGLDVTLVTDAGHEVASITESDPKVEYDIKQYFADHPAEYADLVANYPKPAKTIVTVTTKWVEPGL